MKFSLFLLFVLLPAISLAEEKPVTSADYDLDGDGFLNRSEQASYFLAKKNPTHKDLESDKRLGITEAEIYVWVEKFIGLDGERFANANGYLSVLDAKKIGSLEEKQKDEALKLFPITVGKKELEFRLRKSADDLKKEISEAEPASFAFFRNYLGGEDTWSAEGVLALPIPIYNVDKDNARAPDILPGQVAALNSIDLLPSVAFNRVTGKGGGDLSETDSLEFRLGIGADWQFYKGINGLILTANYRADGTSSGKDFHSSGELDLEPILINPSIGAGYKPVFGIGKAVEYRSRLLAHLEAGEQVVEKVEDNYARVGPKVELHLRPGDAFPSFQKRFSIYAKYSFLSTLTGEFEDAEYYEAGARWALDTQEQILLEASYRYGEVPVKFTDIDLFKVGLSLKF